MNRFKFSLLAIFILVTLVSFYLGLANYVQDGKVTVGDVGLIVAGFAWTALTCWLLMYAPWSARIFAIGFLVGVSVEHAAVSLWIDRDWIGWLPPSYEAQGYYPFSLPLERVLIHVGLMKPFEVPLRALACGMLLSGIVFGGIFYVAWRCYCKRKSPRGPFGG